jgi:AAA+ superfamily predicted ATPase
MKNRDPLKELELLIRSRYCVIFIETLEEERASTLIKHLADHLRIPYFSWTRTKGLRREDLYSKGPVYNTTDLSLALSHIEISQYPAVYHLFNVGDYLEDRIIPSKLRDAAKQFSTNDGIIIITGQNLNIPDILKPISAIFRPPEPDIKEYRDLIYHILRDLRNRVKIKLEMTGEDIDRLINNLKGLTILEAEKILTKALIEDSRLGPEDITRVIEAKKDIVEREGVLEYYPVERSMADIADLNGLKKWLAKRRELITNPTRASEFGLPFPKGILLLGVPGCGKSLCAKAIAMEWSLPLLKLDPANLYNKYIGESEKNFKRAMLTSEKLAPVILWIDEIEKAFSSSHANEDGGVSMRIFGSFLTWLQDRKGDVFIVATANDIDRLPPEFLRKGRFDEIFFVDLPDAESRKAIVEIHLKKRGQDPSDFDIASLVEKTEGFSGSEIEQAIISGLYSAFSAKTQLSTKMLLDEISFTNPISVTMSEKIAFLRDWAKDKTVSAAGSGMNK